MRKQYPAGQIAGLLCQVVVELAQGQSVGRSATSMEYRGPAVFACGPILVGCSCNRRIG